MVWGRGTGDGIGLSHHKGEYSAGVRCGNWVEEKFGAEANGENQDALKAFMVAREAADVAKWGAKLDTAGVARIEPKGSTANPGVNAVMLFSHGPDAGRQWGASMTSLHFPDPKTRKFGYKYGPEHGSKWEGDNMVHKSYYYGIKHIDFVVPKFDPNARSALTTLKASEWRENAAPRRPGAGDGSMYLSDSARMGLRMAPLAGKSAKGRFQFGYE